MPSVDQAAPSSGEISSGLRTKRGCDLSSQMTVATLGLETDLDKDDCNRKQHTHRHDCGDGDQRKARASEDDLAKREADVSDIGIAGIQSIDRGVGQVLAP